MQKDAAFQSEQEAKFIKMTQEPVSGLISKLAIPTICSMLITSIYNMADTYFVSQLDTSASAAVGVVFSLMAVIQAIGFTFGSGSSAIVSRLLGQKKRQEACESLATAFFSTLAVGLVFAALCMIHIEDLVYFLGATDTIAPYAIDYTKYILIGAPYMATNFVLNTSLRGQGNAFWAMIGIMSGGVLNIILDPIFIFTFDMGISGAALATIISQFISFLILLYFNLGNHGAIPLKISNFRFDPKVISRIVFTGAPSLCRQGIASAAMVMMMRCASPFGDAAMAAISIVTRVTMFIASAMIGFGQGFQPVCGFNYGAERYDRVSDAFWFSVKISTIILTIMGAIMFFAAPQVLAAFRRDDALVIAIGTLALRIQCVVMPVQGFTVMCNMYLQCTGQSLRASILSSGRQGIFYIPGTIILPHLFGLTGVQIIQPVADILTLVMALIMSKRFLGDLYRMRDRKLAEVK